MPPVGGAVDPGFEVPRLIVGFLARNKVAPNTFLDPSLAQFGLQPVWLDGPSQGQGYSWFCPRLGVPWTLALKCHG
jgi:hypothetical protein